MEKRKQIQSIRIKVQKKNKALILIDCPLTKLCLYCYTLGFQRNLSRFPLDFDTISSQQDIISFIQC